MSGSGGGGHLDLTVGNVKKNQIYTAKGGLTYKSVRIGGGGHLDLTVGNVKENQIYTAKRRVKQTWTIPGGGGVFLGEGGYSSLTALTGDTH